MPRDGELHFTATLSEPGVETLLRDDDGAQLPYREKAAVRRARLKMTSQTGGILFRHPGPRWLACSH